MSKLELIEVDKFRVIPQWGDKNLRVTKIKCIKRGKALFTKCGKAMTYFRLDNLHDSPIDAINARLKETAVDSKENTRMTTNTKSEIAQCKALLKSL